MKSNRKAKTVRRTARRNTKSLTLSARVARLEKQLLVASPTAAAVATAIAKARFVNLDEKGKPTTGEHVAVYDRSTGITWAADPLEGGKAMNHEAAMNACNGLDLLGLKDWRAPTITELLSIVDYGRSDPAVDPAHFKGPFTWTWTSTPYAGNPSGAAWGVSFGLGLSSWSGHYNSSGLRARAVCSGQPLGLSV